MKSLEKSFLFVCIIVVLTFSFIGCDVQTQKTNDNKVVIWTAGEDYSNDYYLSECKKKFPDYEIILEYMNTSSIAAKVIEEGENCTCDIIIAGEYAYLHKCEKFLAELKDFDYSIFLDELVPESHKFTPELRNGGCIVINPEVLKNYQLPIPTCYQDLLDPKYKGLISMASPLSSGTGYMFLRQLVNEWGEEEAFSYFEKLSENVLQYTSSGSGPINAMIQGEAAIGLGMISQAVTEINDGSNLQILFFEEGAPYSLYGNAVLANSADRECVMEVFEYLATDLCKGHNERFFPDQIFKDFVPKIEGYPADVQFGNMSNDTLEEKERLQAKWVFN